SSQAGSSSGRNIQERSVADVPEELLLLSITAIRFQSVDGGIDVAINDQDVFPAVVIEIDEADAPTEKSCVDTQSRAVAHISEKALPVVLVKRRYVIGKVGLDDVKKSVVIEVGCGGAHASLLLSILIESRAGGYPDIRERAVAIVAEQDARSGI